MIQTQTYINIPDNSDGSKIMSILNLRRTNPEYVSLRDVVNGIVKDASPRIHIKIYDVEPQFL